MDKFGGYLKSDCHIEVERIECNEKNGIWGGTVFGRRFTAVGTNNWGLGYPVVDSHHFNWIMRRRDHGL